jgi:ubiquinol-cytochrome c reductase cytochrome b subunit
LFFDFLFLGWVGQKDVAEPYITLGILATLYYFFFFLILVPVLGILEEKLVYFKPNR